MTRSIELILTQTQSSGIKVEETRLNAPSRPPFAAVHESGNGTLRRCPDVGFQTLAALRGASSGANDPQQTSGVNNR
jgi:hypothetical protein